MKNYLQVRCCFFSALPYHLDLDKISIYLIINGTPTKRQPILEGCIDSRKLKKIESVTLYAEVPNERGFRIYLMKTKREEMLKYFQQNKAAEVCVHVIGFDKQGKEYNLQTNYPKIALLNE